MNTGVQLNLDDLCRAGTRSRQILLLHAHALLHPHHVSFLGNPSPPPVGFPSPKPLPGAFDIGVFLYIFPSPGLWDTPRVSLDSIA